MVYLLQMVDLSVATLNNQRVTDTIVLTLVLTVTPNCSLQKALQTQLGMSQGPPSMGSCSARSCRDLTVTCRAAG